METSLSDLDFYLMLMSAKNARKNSNRLGLISKALIKNWHKESKRPCFNYVVLSNKFMQVTAKLLIKMFPTNMFKKQQQCKSICHLAQPRNSQPNYGAPQIGQFQLNASIPAFY